MPCGRGRSGSAAGIRNEDIGRGGVAPQRPAPAGSRMDSLYLLIPLSVLAALGIAALLVWAVFSGQFERLDDVGTQVLREEPEREEGSGGTPPKAH